MKGELGGENNLYSVFGTNFLASQFCKRIFKLNIRSTALAWRCLWRKFHCILTSSELCFRYYCKHNKSLIIPYQLYFTSELTRLEIEIERPTNWQGRWSWPVTKILSYHPPPPTLTLLHCFSASLHPPLSPTGRIEEEDVKSGSSLTSFKGFL